MCLTGQRIGRAALDPLNLTGAFGDPAPAQPQQQQQAPPPPAPTTNIYPVQPASPAPKPKDKKAERDSLFRQHSDLAIPS
jgi:hypothetical protein